MRAALRAAIASLLLVAGSAFTARADAPDTAPLCTAQDIAAPTPSNPHTLADGYPLLSRALGEEGAVLLEVLVRTDGSVSNAEVKRSSGIARLDVAAADTVTRDWRYKPATKDGKPIACRWQVRVTFRLNDPDFVDSLPFAIVTPGPADWPNGPRARKEEGASVVMVMVQADGTIVDVFLSHSSGSAELDTAAVELVRDRYKVGPGTVEGKAAAAFVPVIVRWTLTPDKS